MLKTAKKKPGTAVVTGPRSLTRLLGIFDVLAKSKEPMSLDTRNIAPMYAGRSLRLCIRRDDTMTTADTWRLWAVNEEGRTTFEVSIT